MPIGPLMLDLEGLTLTEEEKKLIHQPQVGGVILFSRNIESPEQVKALNRQIRSVCPDLILAVDQEGGRVQRIREGVTRLPPLAYLGQLYQEDKSLGLTAARDWGWLMAAEMLALGFDISFAPVLDLDFGRSEVIGDRAFAEDAESVTELASAYVAGMNEAGMAATGKHFPGHGWVRADSHVAIPEDERPFQTITEQDMRPFAELSGCLSGIMPAHVIYSAIDPHPAGFSSFWIQQVLREQLGFTGVVFSDDLTMEGAAVAGSYVNRAEQALAAGCDMVLVCNHRQGAVEVLDWLSGHLPGSWAQESRPRLLSLQAKGQWDLDALHQEKRWQSCNRQMQDYWQAING